LAKLRKAFADGEESPGFGEAFQSLSRHDPTPVAEYLVRWKNPNRNWSDTDRGYVLGSYFAWRCGSDRKKHLTRLLEANDPFVRVAGAVYLCYEDAEMGTAALKKFTRLEGDPGVWAALTLARRGHADAVPRALEVFRELPADQKENQFGMAGVPHRNLQKRVLVLLSNSARAGGVPQPRLPESEEKQFADLIEWWKRHGDRVVLSDPWLKVLERQKVD
jgi:hypothetical protein